MKAADRLKSYYVLIFGEEELAARQVLARNMEDGEQKLYDLQKLEQLINILGECAQ